MRANLNIPKRRYCNFCRKVIINLLHFNSCYERKKKTTKQQQKTQKTHQQQKKPTQKTLQKNSNPSYLQIKFMISWGFFMSTIQTKYFFHMPEFSHFLFDTCLSSPACSGCCQERTRSSNHCGKGIFLAQCANVGKGQQKKAVPALGFRPSQLCTPLLFKNAFKLPCIFLFMCC